jgi:hypothetical protein
VRAGVVTVIGGTADEERVWPFWIAAGVVAWVVLACLVAVVVGRSVRLADRRSAGATAPLSAH